MNCIKCSSELKEGAKFCGKCGTPQTATAPSAPRGATAPGHPCRYPTGRPEAACRDSSAHSSAAVRRGCVIN